MKQITILLFKDRGSPVGRYQIPVSLVERWKIIAIVVGIVFLAGLIDYGRARVRTWELNDLRQESAAHREYIENLTLSMDQLEQELERLHELERKMRIIADVPGPEVGEDHLDGVGGGEENDSEAKELDAEPKVPVNSSSFRPTLPKATLKETLAPTQDVLVSAEDFDAQAVSQERLSRLHHETQRLQARAESQEQAFSVLVDHLHAQSDRLASTPSIWPTKGWLTSGYGYRTSPHTGQQQFHGALDIAGRAGTDVIAPGKARVVFSGKKRLLGNVVILEHGYGIRTTYAHNSKLYVKRGETVERGEMIAKTGSTGRSTGPHLHYAIDVNGKSVNPLNYILD